MTFVDFLKFFLNYQNFKSRNFFIKLLLHLIVKTRLFNRVKTTSFCKTSKHSEKIIMMDYIFKNNFLLFFQESKRLLST